MNREKDGGQRQPKTIGKAFPAAELKSLSLVREDLTSPQNDFNNLRKWN
jgi:hypothetical protein